MLLSGKSGIVPTFQLHYNIKLFEISYTSIFGENLFDDFMNDDFMRGFAPGFMREFAKFDNPVFGRREKNLLKTDVKDNGDTYELDMDLPGFKKEDITAKLDNGYLTISASRGMNKEEKDEQGNYIRRERYSGTCQRSFYVGSQLTQEEIKARFENGILHLSFPKADARKEIPEQKHIAIEG